jgi:hypothetical protein
MLCVQLFILITMIMILVSNVVFYKNKIMNR